MSHVSLQSLRCDLIWMSGCFSKSLSENREAFNQIRLIFWKSIEELDQSKAVYFHHFVKELKNEKPDICQMEKAENHILQFCSKFKPFIQAVIHSDTIAPYIDFLCQSNQRQITQLKMVFSAARLCQKLKDLELSTKMKVPTKVLLKISLEEKLLAEDKDQIDRWIVALQAAKNRKIPSCEGPLNNSFVHIRFQHSLLNDLVHFFSEIDKQIKADLGLLEMDLQKMGLSSLEEFDAKHNAWRMNLRTGDAIKIGDKVLRLGELLKNRERFIDQPLVFAVEGNSDEEVIIEKSEREAYKIDLEQRVLHCGIIRAKVLAASCGRVLLYERLSHSLTENKWPQFNKKSTSQEFDFSSAIVSLMQGFMKMPYTPYPLIPEAFACYKYSLRATMTLIPTAKNFEAIENFAYLCAKGISKAFTYLMTESGLAKSPWSQSYQALVRMALDREDQTNAISQNRSIKDEYVIRARNNLYAAIVNGYTILLAELEKRYEDFSLTKIRAAIKHKIMEKHQLLCPGSLLINSFFDIVRYEIFYQFRPKLKACYLNPLRQEIITQMRTGKSLQDPIVKKWQNRKWHRKEGIFNIEQIESIWREGSSHIDPVLLSK